MLTVIVALLLLPAQTAASGHMEPHIRAAQNFFDDGTRAAAEKQQAQAAIYFQKAIAIEPTFLEVRTALISLYSGMGDSLHEAAAITEYLEIKPNSIAYRIRLGQLLIAQGQQRKALAQFDIALKNDANNADALLGFASAASQLGMHAQADQAIARGKQAYPSDPRFQSQHP